MLVIRNEQMRQLDALMRSRLRDELVDGLASLNPTENRAVLMACATDALEIGERLGITNGNGFGDLASLLFDLGPGVLNHPTIAAVMDSHSIPAEQRLASLFELGDATWTKVRADLARGEAAGPDAVRTRFQDPAP